ncbi:hypothetical protein S83_066521, partial [Arachis hypogaea]
RSVDFICATPASSRFANNNNNNDALVPAIKNINRPSMVVNVKVLKKLFSVNNYQKKPRRRSMLSFTFNHHVYSLAYISTVQVHEVKDIMKDR